MLLINTLAAGRLPRSEIRTVICKCCSGQLLVKGPDSAFTLIIRMHSASEPTTVNRILAGLTRGWMKLTKKDGRL